MKMFILVILAAGLFVAGCGDDVKFSMGGTHTAVKCVEGYKFVVVQMDKSVAITQTMPPQRCADD